MKPSVRAIIFKFTSIKDRSMGLLKFKAVITKIRTTLLNDQNLKNPIINGFKKKNSSAIVVDAKFDIKVTIVNESETSTYMLISLMPSLASDPYATVIDAVRINISCTIAFDKGTDIYVEVAKDPSCGDIFNTVISDMLTTLDVG